MKHSTLSSLNNAELELVSGGRQAPTLGMREASQSSGNVELNEEVDELFEPQTAV